jgi:hypothetical protein
MPKFYVEYENVHEVVDAITRHAAARKVVRKRGDETPENVSVNERGFKLQDACSVTFDLTCIIPGCEL